MAFDAAPQHRLAPDCAACPVAHCPARCAETASGWRGMVSLLPSQQPGCAELVRAGEPLAALFTVRAGCIKSYTLDAQGNEHIRAFHFPGDLVGLEALGLSRAPSSSAPVTPSQVCAVPVAEVQRRLGSDAALGAHLLAKTRDALGQATALAGEYSADQRVAAFLLHVHARIGSGPILRLPMTRREMGSYLRLATETVCRVLTRFEQKGWLVSAEKRITLFDQAALRQLAEPVGMACAA